MTKTLLTGASGLIGSHLAKALAARGDELRVLARRNSDLGGLEGLEYERVTGDITDRRAIRRALDGASKVFNVAGRTSLRAADREAVFAANLRGARTLFEEALKADVERFVQTSTVGAIGVAKPGGTADESTPFEIGHLGLAYVNSKHEAELEAFRAAAHGLPIVIVNPTFVLGPDVPSGTRGSSMGLVRRFLRGQIPAYVDGGINVVDVRDVAAGHLLADERGEVGERYILGARNFTFDRLFADLSRISGVAPPPIKLPAAAAAAGASFAERIGLPVERRRGPLGRAVVDVQEHEGEARARLQPATPRGDARGRRQLAGEGARRPGGGRLCRRWRCAPARARRRRGRLTGR